MTAGLAGDPILAAKITVPGVPGWAVQRPRVTELITQGTRWFPLTVLTGPPGAGKTMALALWAAAEPGPVAWVSLDGYDNHPGMFWSYVVAALRGSGLTLPEALPTAGREAGHLFLLRLVAALADQDPAVTLVLDDLHLVTEPEVLDGLDFVLRNVGAGLRVAAASRMDPPLPLHRYRVAGQLAEVRAADLAFSAAEAGLLLDQHGCTLSPESLECLTRRTEGWAAGLRLAGLSMAAHPDPDQFVKELAAEDSALTGYLVDEVLSTQPPEVQQVLLYTSILDRVSADTAAELTGDEQAGGILAALARANAFVQPAGGGWYRYHTLFAEVLRLKLRYEHPDRVAGLHRRAARWHERNGELAEAVRHCAEAGDWPLAARLVTGDLAIGEILEPRPGQSLAGRFRGMPAGRAWDDPGPYLIAAALALSAGQAGSCAIALEAADRLIERLPGDQEPAGRLTAELIRLTAALRTGDLAAAAAAAGRAERLAARIPDGRLARHPDVGARIRCGRGAVELWSGRLDEAARILQAGAAVPGRPEGPADGLGQLALAEALRGRLRRAAQLARQAARADGEHRPAGPDAAALIALAWAHLEHYELREARGRLKEADAALGARPDKLTGTLAHLVTAGVALAEGRAGAAAQILAGARAGWPVPPWLDRQLSLVQSRACLAAGDIPAARAAAEHAGRDNPLEAAVTLAQAQAAAGDGGSARRTLAHGLEGGHEGPDRARVRAWLADARLHYAGGDQTHGRRSLAAALRLAEPEQLRLPFAEERGWLGRVLRQEPQLADRHRRLLGLVPRRQQLPAPGEAPVLVVEPLTEREREVLRHVSHLMNTAEVASEMYISVNTVKTHLRSIYRKLAAGHRSEAVRRARQLELI